ncbi:MAG: FmdB family zinc ribbon protein [Chloroflexota bacterium]
MPLYEYACAVCGHRFEIRQGIRDASLTECPECAGAIRLVVHPVGIVFKGSGFYKTDSRTAGEARVSAGEKKTESSNGAESTPAADKAKDGATAPAAKETTTTPNGTGGAAASAASAAGKTAAGERTA